MPDIPDPIRQQLVDARRQQILEGAARVLAEKGFHNATNKDIAEAAGVAYGTIYNYFTNKADLLIGILNRLDEMDIRAEQMEAALQLSFHDALLAFLRRHQEQYLPNMEMFKAILPEVLVNPELRALYYQQNVVPTQQMFEAQLETRMERGELRQVDGPMVARILMQLLLGGMLMQLLGNKPPEAGDNGMDKLADLLLNGLAHTKEP